MISSKPTFVQLGGKTKTESSNKQNMANSFSSLRANSPEFKTPYSMSNPIVIRYIDPRIVPLFMELGKITKMVQNIVSCSTVNENKEEIQTLIRSTKEINEKVLMIMEENSASFSASSDFGNIVNKTEQVKSEYQYKIEQKCVVESTFEKGIQRLQQKIKAEQIDMVSILNRVSQRLQELQNENQSLKVQLAQEKAKSHQLSNQKSQLVQTLRQKQNQSKVKISQLQQELTSLTNNSSLISSRIAKLSLMISQ